MTLSQAEDFRMESEVLHGLLEPLDDTDFERPTLFKDWTINDILRHLHHGNILADLSLNDEVAFHETYAKIKNLRDGGMDEAMDTSLVLDQEWEES